MIVGVGIDVVDVARFGQSIERTPRLLDRLFTESERALPLASLAGEHVVFDLLDALLPERVKRWQAVISNLLCTFLLGVAAWFVFSRALRTQAMGDTTAQLLVPVAPFHFAAAVLLVICALMHLYLASTGRSRS